MHAKLIIVVETEKEKILRKEFVFDDTKVSPSENFLLFYEKTLQQLLSSIVCSLSDFFFLPAFCLDCLKKREGFCQLLQQMKNKHSEKPEPDMITVFVGTWNMGKERFSARDS